uniref:Putative secreted protein n=1 Tax=Ixodes ricinus TaxID=34613 RepID=A0A6B0U6K1_IXORI
MVLVTVAVLTVILRSPRKRAAPSGVMMRLATASLSCMGSLVVLSLIWPVFGSIRPLNTESASVNSLPVSSFIPILRMNMS